ncbi:DUF397 domain-containing protein [Nocardiopsis ansamitocini]|uniref:DUF397 domain-containing protein n=1 Tax=Nocardiopsis ansamitocini TaxID=1670832 RepID=A0A9W6PAG3_9ACTN|nr:DUF397 domain-containing protein [Nocardiopsis ansamitocini]GLU49989.1 hypothetical protein Nans01_43400 [Nocardiopsis ansamitocini]
MTSPHWHTSSYSGPNGGNCVEVAETSIGAVVRDTQNRDKETLLFPVGEWTAFLRDVQTGTL